MCRKVGNDTFQEGQSIYPKGVVNAFGCCKQELVRLNRVSMYVYLPSTEHPDNAQFIVGLGA